MLEDIVNDPRWGLQSSRRKECGYCLRWPGNPAQRCVRCLAWTCGSCAEPCRGCELLEQLRLICADAQTPVDTDESARKTAQIIRTFGKERDALLSGAGLWLRVLEDGRRHSYYPQGGPFVLRQVLQHAKSSSVRSSVVARVPSSLIWIPAHQSVSELVWILPNELGVELRFRSVGADGFPTQAQPIPVEGPWALPSPWVAPVWHPPTPFFVENTGFACPHCNVCSSRYRALENNTFVCSACGRSFEESSLAKFPRVS